MLPAAACGSTGRSPDADMQALKCPHTDDAGVLSCAPPGRKLYRRPGHEIKRAIRPTSRSRSRQGERPSSARQRIREDSDRKLEHDLNSQVGQKAGL